jgi:adenylosuccinate synthase
MTRTDLIVRDMLTPAGPHEGRTSFIVGGQWGSEAKGSAAAWLAYELAKKGKQYDIVTTNAGAQAGHTSIHKSTRRVSFHLPTAPFIFQDEGGYNGIIYLNAGSVIDVPVLLDELKLLKRTDNVFIHPNAAIITQECKDAEMDAASSNTKIASTRKGVGQAIARKVCRSGLTARDCPELKDFVRRLDLNWYMREGRSVLVEVPQGVSLSLNHSGFYPHTTSRDCTPAQAMSEAGMHPSFYGSCMVVLRTYPIRVGNIVENGEELGQSGACYFDQKETTWEELGQTAEITTVTKRVRRVFTFSAQQILETFIHTRPDCVFLSFCNYVRDPKYLDYIERSIYDASKLLWFPPPRIVYEFGPETTDVSEEYAVPAGTSVVPVNDRGRSAPIDGAIRAAAV